MVIPVGGRGRVLERDGDWLPGCYPGEQWGENFLGEDEPSDGHEASSNTSIEYLTPGVVQQVDPTTRPEGKFKRDNQRQACTLPHAPGPVPQHPVCVCRCEDTHRRGPSRGRRDGCWSSPSPDLPPSWPALTLEPPAPSPPGQEAGDKWLIQEAAVTIVDLGCYVNKSS